MQHIYVGIDIAKPAHEAAVLDDSGTLAGSTLKVPNTTARAQKLLIHFDKVGVPTENCVIGMEATGHYWLAIYSFLVGKGYTVKAINPIVTDSYRNMSVRKTMTDQIDARKLSNLQDKASRGRFGKDNILSPR